MKVYFASDHGGFESKAELMKFVRDELGHAVEDCGALKLDPADDYPAIIAGAAQKLSADVRAGIESRAIIGGASGQGEAMVANRYHGVRCAVYYGKAEREQLDMGGKQLDMLQSVRQHNDANAISFGYRFMSLEEAKAAAKEFLSTPFPNDERHLRRLRQIDLLP